MLIKIIYCTVRFMTYKALILLITFILSAQEITWVKTINHIWCKEIFREYDGRFLYLTFGMNLLGIDFQQILNLLNEYFATFIIYTKKNILIQHFSVYKHNKLTFFIWMFGTLVNKKGIFWKFTYNTQSFLF